MPRKPVRVVIDTNLWISFLITKKHTALDALLLSGKVKLLFNKESLSEFHQVVRRPKLRKHFPPSDVEELFSLFDTYGEVVRVESDVSLCRDPKDDFLLSLARSGGADFLVTGDLDLLNLKSFERTKILSFVNFLTRFRRVR